MHPNLSSATRRAAIYLAFAVVATAANLGSQWAVVQFSEAFVSLPHKTLVFFALVVGTGVGLVIKYILDKTYIFEDRSTGAKIHAKKFGLYSLMGLATTVIFWGAEFLAVVISNHPYSMYVGGGLGLAVGYVVKYQLDRRFVFDRPAIQ
jgi:putative flippase GtrA